jgi:type IV pilus assembly protein PilM
MRYQTTLGIDISNNRINLALLHQGRQGIELLKTASTAVPEGAVIGGDLKNAPLLAKTVKELCCQNKIPAKNAVISLVAKPSIVRIMHLPKDLSANYAQYVRDELKRYAVMSGKTIVHDFCPLAPQKNSGAVRLLLGAADEEKTADLAKAFNRAGINIKAVEPNVLAHIRLLYANYVAQKFTSNILIAAVEDTAATLCVFSNVSLNFIRTVEIGEADLRSEQGIQNLLSEIHEIKQFYDVELGSTSKQWDVVIALSCENQDNERLRQTLQNSITYMNVQISSPATLREDAQLIMKEQPAAVSPISVGLAMRFFKTGPADLKINLLPAGADAVHNMQKFALTTAIVVIIVFLLSLLAVPALKAQLKEINLTITKYQEAKLPENIRKLMQEEAALDRKNEALTKNAQAVKSIISTSASKDWPKILRDIGYRTPKNLRITHLTAKNSTKMILEGQALSFDQVNMFIALLEKSPFIASVKLAKSQIDPAAHDLLSYNIICSFTADKEAKYAD